MIELEGIYYIHNDENDSHHFAAHNQIDFQHIKDSEHLEIFKVNLEKLDMDTNIHNWLTH